jgi:hypothetical protein
LYIDDLPITDDGLQRLTRMSRLHWLSASGTKISDRSSDVLERLTELKHLRLAPSAISPHHLQRLARLPSLVTIEYFSPGMSSDEEAARKLKEHFGDRLFLSAGPACVH